MLIVFHPYHLSGASAFPGEPRSQATDKHSREGAKEAKVPCSATLGIVGMLSGPGQVPTSEALLCRKEEAGPEATHREDAVCDAAHTSWETCSSPHNLASAVGHQVPVRSLSARESSQPLGFVNVTLACLRLGSAPLSCVIRSVPCSRDLWRQSQTWFLQRLCACPQISCHAATKSFKQTLTSSPACQHQEMKNEP